MCDNAILNERLERYGITARGQIARGPSVGEIAGYAAAAGVGLVMAGTADAAVIYSGVQNLTMSIPWATTNFKGNSFNRAAASVAIPFLGSDRVQFRLSFQGNLDDDNGRKTTYYGVASLHVLNDAQLMGTGFESARGGYNLPRGALIGPGGNFSAASAGMTHGQKIGSAAHSVGRFLPLDRSGFVGLRFASTGDQGGYNYGWIRLLIADLGDNNPFKSQGGALSGKGYPDQITIVDWAYESTPNTAIEAPAPTPLALLAAGAVGIAALRRRKEEAAGVRAD